MDMRRVPAARTTGSNAGVMYDRKTKHTRLDGNRRNSCGISDEVRRDVSQSRKEQRRGISRRSKLFIHLDFQQGNHFFSFGGAQLHFVEQIQFTSCGLMPYINACYILGYPL